MHVAVDKAQFTRNGTSPDFFERNFGGSGGWGRGRASIRLVSACHFSKLTHTHLAVGKTQVPKMEYWSVETGTKTCGPLMI